MKLCIDCKHHVEHMSSWCTVHRTMGDPNPVDGRVEELGVNYCSMERGWWGKCGPEGKLFEPRPKPGWQFW